MLLRVELPGTAPFIAAGLRISASIALILAVATELLSGFGQGLGIFIAQAQLATDGTRDVLAGVVWAGALGLAVNGVLVWGERRAFPWTPERRGRVGEPESGRGSPGGTGGQGGQGSQDGFGARWPFGRGVARREGSGAVRRKGLGAVRRHGPGVVRRDGSGAVRHDGWADPRPDGPGPGFGPGAEPGGSGARQPEEGGGDPADGGSRT